MGLPTADKRDNHLDLPCPKTALYSVLVNLQTWRLQHVWHKCKSACSFFFLWVDEYQPVSSQKQTELCCAYYEQNIQHKSICWPFFLAACGTNNSLLSYPLICMCCMQKLLSLCHKSVLVEEFQHIGKKSRSSSTPTHFTITLSLGMILKGDQPQGQAIKRLSH